MKRRFAIAVFSILSFGIPQFANAGQAAGYPARNPEAYVQNVQWGNRAPVDNRQYYGRGWDDRGGYRDRDYRNDYYRYNSYRDDRYYRGDYDRGYYDRDRHAGRSVAIIGGSAAAGAVVGGITGQGKGAAIGALIGGVGGVIADQAVRHHDRRY